MHPTDEFSDWLIHQFLQNCARRVNATEAFACLIDRSRLATGLLQWAAHIRPDDSTEQTRRTAREAFEQIARPCIEQGKPGAIDVGAPDPGDPQLCLVVPFPPNREIRLIFGLIIRAPNEPTARAKLNTLYGWD